MTCRRFTLLTLVLIAFPAAQAQQSSGEGQSDASSPNRFLNVANQYREDLGSLNRFYKVQVSADRCRRLLKFQANWQAGLEAFDLTSLPKAEQDTAERLRARIQQETQTLLHDLNVSKKLAVQHPFTVTLISLIEARQRIDPVEPRTAAEQVSEMIPQVKEARQQWKSESETFSLTQAETFAAFRSLKSHTSEWFQFYNGYDPLFSWWLKQPYSDFEIEMVRLVQQLAPDKNGQKKEERPESETDESRSTQNPITPDRIVDIEALLSPPNQRLPELIAEYSEAKRKPRSRSGRSTRSSEEKTDPKTLYETWKERLNSIAFDQLSRSDQVDYLLLQYDIDYQLARLALPQKNIEIKWSLPEDPRSLSGYPIGAEALQVELDHEMIRYSPEELVSIAEQELQWCRTELIKASNEMGLGDDWRAAIEQVKNMHVEPGQQPAMIKELALEAIDYLKSNDRLSIPPLAEETWRMTMMSPERQLVNPFFLGGEVIQVSYPTDTMKHRDKLESMRGNNIPFARATVHHELIPGHHLQIFSSKRNKPYRRPFATPFWMEGWALYWEMMLYDAGFPKEAKDRIGFLVWRSHRCARIVFSLNFHLGKMTPPECVDLLVNWVGFDRNNAAAEVRRSVGRGYSPLYQAAYMLGGLQIRQLRKEIVDSGQMTEKEFHDAILQENSIPISLLRAVLTKAPLSRDQKFHWKFYGDVKE